MNLYYVTDDHYFYGVFTGDDPRKVAKKAFDMIFDDVNEEDRHLVELFVDCFTSGSIILDSKRQDYILQSHQNDIIFNLVKKERRSQ